MVGAALLVVPGAASDLWPWPLTDLTARATGAWALAIGAAAGLGAWENDWRRLRAPLAANLALPVLAGIALARYSETPDWGHPGSSVLLLVLASMLALGIAGLREAHRARGAVRPHERSPSEGGRTEAA